MTLTKTQRVKLRDACETVERYIRLLGHDVVINVAPTGVEIADITWDGTSVDKTLFTALKDALSYHD